MDHTNNMALKTTGLNFHSEVDIAEEMGIWQTYVRLPLILKKKHAMM